MYAIPTSARSIEKAIDIFKPCTVTYTSNSKYIVCEQGEFIYTTEGLRLEGHELAFVKSFREYFKKNGKSLQYDKSYVDVQPEYSRFFVKEGVYDNIVEVDVNRAYPTAGRILGIIPDSLYERGCRLTKHAFLVAIGSLYRKKKVIFVDSKGKRKLLMNEEREPHMADIWKSIVGFMDVAMKKAATTIDKGLYFYWCDAVFISKEKADDFVKRMEEQGFNCKKKAIRRLEFVGQKALVRYESLEEKPKEFCFSSTMFEAKTLKEVREKHEQATRKS
jgi:hypothetical protein